MTSSAKSWTHFWICSWSSLSAKSAMITPGQRCYLRVTIPPGNQESSGISGSRYRQQRRGNGLVDQFGSGLVDVDPIPSIGGIGGDGLIGAPLGRALDERDIRRVRCGDLAEQLIQVG